MKRDKRYEYNQSVTGYGAQTMSHAAIKLRREGGTPKRTNQSKAGKLRLFCDWLTKQRQGWR